VAAGALSSPYRDVPSSRIRPVPQFRLVRHRAYLGGELDVTHHVLAKVLVRVTTSDLLQEFLVRETASVRVFGPWPEPEHARSSLSIFWKTFGDSLATTDQPNTPTPRSAYTFACQPIRT